LVDTNGGGLLLISVVGIDLLLVLGEGLKSEGIFFFGAVVSSVSGNILQIFGLNITDGGEECGILGGGEG
jgi:hypothetical protein